MLRTDPEPPLVTEVVTHLVDPDKLYSRAVRPPTRRLLIGQDAQAATPHLTVAGARQNRNTY